MQQRLPLLPFPIHSAAIAATCLLALAQAPGYAQPAQPAAGQSSTVLIYTHAVVKPDHITTYTDNLKKRAEAYKKAGVPYFHVYQGMAGNPFEFLLIREVPSMAALEDTNVLSKVMSEAERVRLNMERDQCTESVRVTYLNGVAVVGQSGMKKYRIYSRIRVRPGSAEAYETAIKQELVPALAKDDTVRYRLRRVAWGGSASDYIATYDSDTLPNGPSPTARNMSPTQLAAYNKKMSELSSGVERLIYRYRADLSSTNGAPTNATR